MARLNLKVGDTFEVIDPQSICLGLKCTITSLYENEIRGNWSDGDVDGLWLRHMDGDDSSRIKIISTQKEWD